MVDYRRAVAAPAVLDIDEGAGPSELVDLSAALYGVTRPALGTSVTYTSSRKVLREPEF